MGVVSRRRVWVEYMGVATGCGCKKAYIYNYIDFLILLIPTPCLSVLYSNIPTFCSFI